MYQEEINTIVNTWVAYGISIVILKLLLIITGGF